MQVEMFWHKVDSRVLRDENGVAFPVNLSLSLNGKVAYIKKGWKEFSLEKNLERGSIVRFRVDPSDSGVIHTKVLEACSEPFFIAMTSRYDFIKDVNGGSEYKIWRLKVRVIRLWRFANFQENNNSNVKPMIEMVVIDEQRETEVRLVEDSTIPVNAFCFVPYNDILNESNEERHLVDVVGLLSAKGDLIEFKRNGKVCNYLVIELDNLEQLDEDSFAIHVVVLQFAKMKYFKGTMGVSNNTYNSKLFLNPQVPEVDSLKTSDENYSQPVTQLPGHVTLTAEEEFLNRLEYKTIAELKDVNQYGVYSTVGTIKEIESEYNWCYRGCKKCSYGMKIDGNMFYCKNCNIHYSTFVTRYETLLCVV
ncbi:Nucleic acid-binding, OB-fold [Sesbania bispinosa]|nr:Nucleic acid-binding, OB-fold [Sesbania bispinosa]